MVNRRLSTRRVRGESGSQLPLPQITKKTTRARKAPQRETPAEAETRLTSLTELSPRLSAEGADEASAQPSNAPPFSEYAEDDLILAPTSFNIRTGIRFRPPQADEEDLGATFKLEDASVTDPRGNTFSYDKIWTDKDRNSAIFQDSCVDIVHSCLRGFNGTIFAYGQTSSGKTHTMLGDGGNEPGIVPLAVQEIFRRIARMENREFVVSLSYIEVYNEKLIDLLEPTAQAPGSGRPPVATAGPKKELSIVEKPDGNVELLNLSMRTVRCPDDVTRAIDEAQRHVAFTAQNHQSSRSHAILRLRVESSSIATGQTPPPTSPTPDSGSATDRTDKENVRPKPAAEGDCGPNGMMQQVAEDNAHLLANSVRVGLLYLVDLAGSEAISRAQTEGIRLLEGKSINKSLLALSNVITLLASRQEAENKGKKFRQHVGFRDSKLTRLLQPSLGGNSRTVVICCCAPGRDNVRETLSTLDFGSRVKSIKNRCKVNLVLGEDVSEIRKLRLEKAHTLFQLEQTEGKNVRIIEKLRELSQDILNSSNKLRPPRMPPSASSSEKDEVDVLSYKIAEKTAEAQQEAERLRNDIAKQKRVADELNGKLDEQMRSLNAERELRQTVEAEVAERCTEIKKLEAELFDLRRTKEDEFVQLRQEMQATTEDWNRRFKEEKEERERLNQRLVEEKEAAAISAGALQAEIDRERAEGALKSAELERLRATGEDDRTRAIEAQAAAEERAKEVAATAAKAFAEERRAREEAVLSVARLTEELRSEREAAELAAEELKNQIRQTEEFRAEAEVSGLLHRDRKAIELEDNFSRIVEMSEINESMRDAFCESERARQVAQSMAEMLRGKLDEEKAARQEVLKSAMAEEDNKRVHISRLDAERGRLAESLEEAASCVADFKDKCAALEVQNEDYKRKITSLAESCQTNGSQLAEIARELEQRSSECDGLRSALQQERDKLVAEQRIVSTLRICLKEKEGAAVEATERMAEQLNESERKGADLEKKIKILETVLDDEQSQSAKVKANWQVDAENKKMAFCEVEGLALRAQIWKAEAMDEVAKLRLTAEGFGRRVEELQKEKDEASEKHVKDVLEIKKTYEDSMTAETNQLAAKLYAANESVYNLEEDRKTAETTLKTAEAQLIAKTKIVFELEEQISRLNEQLSFVSDETPLRKAEADLAKTREDISALEKLLEEAEKATVAERTAKEEAMILAARSNTETLEAREVAATSSRRAEELDKYSTELWEKAENQKNQLEEAERKLEEMDLKVTIEVQKCLQLESASQDFESILSETLEELETTREEAAKTIAALRRGSSEKSLALQKMETELQCEYAERQEALAEVGRLTKNRHNLEEELDTLEDANRSIVASMTDWAESVEKHVEFEVIQVSQSSKEMVQALTDQVELHLSKSVISENVLSCCMESSAAKEFEVLQSWAGEIVTLQLIAIIAQIKILQFRDSKISEFEESVTKLKSSLGEAERQNSALGLERSEYRRQANQTKQKLAGLETELQQMALDRRVRLMELPSVGVDTSDFDEISSGPGTVRAKRRRVSDLETSNESLQQTLGGLEEQLRDEKRKWQNLMHDVEMLKVESENLKLKFSESETSLAASKAEQTATAEQLREVETQVAQLREDNAALEEKLCVSEAKLRGVSTSKEEAVAEADRLRRLVQTTPENLERLDKAQLATEIAYLTKEAKKWRDETTRAWNYVRRLTGEKTSNDELEVEAPVALLRASESEAAPPKDVPTKTHSAEREVVEKPLTNAVSTPAGPEQVTVTSPEEEKSSSSSAAPSTGREGKRRAKGKSRAAADKENCKQM